MRNGTAATIIASPASGIDSRAATGYRHATRVAGSAAAVNSRATTIARCAMTGDIDATGLGSRAAFIAKCAAGIDKRAAGIAGRATINSNNAISIRSRARAGHSNAGAIHACAPGSDARAIIIYPGAAIISIRAGGWRLPAAPVGRNTSPCGGGTTRGNRSATTGGFRAAAGHTGATGIDTHCFTAGAGAPAGNTGAAAGSRPGNALAQLENW
ncbi:MAG: hypothetical protein EOO11_07615 [Chitinophagaceae bacterium]|nr:MAG: hypothetical protein EOO11_07615 [Chitinophagaceae bacterium]